MSATSESVDFPSNGHRTSISRQRRFFTEFRNGETRRVAVGYLDKRLHLLCYIPKADGIRVISFRKTNKREAKLYGKPQTIN
jgi:uncharacterized DUF497 family protein